MQKNLKITILWVTFGLKINIQFEKNALDK
jgi:hypothetical protein